MLRTISNNWFFYDIFLSNFFILFTYLKPSVRFCQSAFSLFPSRTIWWCSRWLSTALWLTSWRLTPCHGHSCAWCFRTSARGFRIFTQTQAGGRWSIDLAFVTGWPFFAFDDHRIHLDQKVLFKRSFTSQRSTTYSIFDFQGHKYKQYSGPLRPILQPERLQVQPEDQRPELLHCFGRERVGLLCREQLIVRGGNGAVHGPGVAGRRPQPAGLWVRSQAGRCLRHGADLLGSRETVQRFVSGMIYHWKKFTFVIFKCFYSFGQILNLSFVFHDSGNRSPRFLLGVPNWAGPPSEIANFRGDENLSRPQQGPSPLPLRVEGLQPGSATSQGNHRVLLGPRRRGQTDFAVRRGADPGVVDSLGSISK